MSLRKVTAGPRTTSSSIMLYIFSQMSEILRPKCSQKLFRIFRQCADNVHVEDWRSIPKLNFSNFNWLSTNGFFGIPKFRKLPCCMTMATMATYGNHKPPKGQMLSGNVDMWFDAVTDYMTLLSGWWFQEFRIFNIFQPFLGLIITNYCLVTKTTLVVSRYISDTLLALRDITCASSYWYKRVNFDELWCCVCFCVKFPTNLATVRRCK